MNLISPTSAKGFIPEPAGVYGPKAPNPTIDVGTIQVVAGSADETVTLFVVPPGTTPPSVTGFNLRAQLGDGLGAAAEPVFTAVDFSGGLWDTHTTMTSGGIVASAEQLAQASVVFADTGNSTSPDGLLVTLRLDTTGFTPGETFDLKLSETDIAAASDFILAGGKPAPSPRFLTAGSN